MAPPKPDRRLAKAHDIARVANATNNAMHQQLRLERWTSVRDQLWGLAEPLLASDAWVAIIGGGSCDDVPLARIAARATRVDLIDVDPESTARAMARLPRDSGARVCAQQHDVTSGSADRILRAVRDDEPLPTSLPLLYGALGSGAYDLVIGDMLYTQLLHAGLIALNVHGPRQQELMRRYDQYLVNSLVQRIQASLTSGGHAIHVHDVACWASGHTQPITLEQALAEPTSAWDQLLRHDNCDPHLVLERIGADIRSSTWWEWPFEPNKRFLVRATVARAGVGAGSASQIATVFRST